MPGWRRNSGRRCSRRGGGTRRKKKEEMEVEEVEEGTEAETETEIEIETLPPLLLPSGSSSPRFLRDGHRQGSGPLRGARDDGQVPGGLLPGGREGGGESWSFCFPLLSEVFFFSFCFFSPIRRFPKLTFFLLSFFLFSKPKNNDSATASPPSASSSTPSATSYASATCCG